MSCLVEPIEQGRHDLKPLLEELGRVTSEKLDVYQAGVLMKRWRALVAKGTGFVLIDGGECAGVLLYSAEYELRFSSFLSDVSAQRLPRNVTIWLCYVAKKARDESGANDTLLLKSAISRLRADATVETIAVQATSLYEADLEGTLSAIGFMSCRRVRMKRRVSGRLPRPGGPPGCKLEKPTRDDAGDLMSVIYSGYFAEIDGYLFPDISAVCSDINLFKEFLSHNAVNLAASVLARTHGFPCGCIIALTGEVRRSALIGIVASSPGIRRRGVGRAMLSYVLRKFQEMHYEQATLAVTVENIPAVSLYKSLDFQEMEQQTRISVWRRSVSRPLMNFRQ
jgi:ribosomal protein S18 acetylase RimI-like enzyme